MAAAAVPAVPANTGQARELLDGAAPEAGAPAGGGSRSGGDGGAREQAGVAAEEDEDEDEDEDEEVAGVDEYVWTQETLQILEECQEETADELVTTRLALRNVCMRERERQKCVQRETETDGERDRGMPETEKCVYAREREREREKFQEETADELVATVSPSEMCT